MSWRTPATKKRSLLPSPRWVASRRAATPVDTLWSQNDSMSTRSAEMPLKILRIEVARARSRICSVPTKVTACEMLSTFEESSRRRC